MYSRSGVPQATGRAARELERSGRDTRRLLLALPLLLLQHTLFHPAPVKVKLNIQLYVIIFFLFVITTYSKDICILYLMFFLNFAISLNIGLCAFVCLHMQMHKSQFF